MTQILRWYTGEVQWGSLFRKNRRIEMSKNYLVMNKFRRHGYTWYELEAWATMVPAGTQTTRLIDADVNVCIGDVVRAEPGETNSRASNLVIKKVISRKLKNPRKENTMAMSKDRVRFLIGLKYIHTLLRREAMADVMAKAFGVNVQDALKYLSGSYGVWITCRPSQFARFMIYRNKANIENGFKDLKAELFETREIDPYLEVADLSGVSVNNVRAVVETLGFGKDWLMNKIKAAAREDLGREIDVSKNPA